MRRSIALCLLVTLIVTGCTVAPKAKNDAPATGTVRVLVIGGSGLEPTLFSAFSNANPGVKAESVKLADDDDFAQVVAKIKSGETKVDAIVAPANNFLFAQGVVAPLDDFVKSEKISLKEFGDAIEMGKYQNKLYGLPVTLSPMVVMYNKDLFDKAGLPVPAANWTWADFEKDAQVLTPAQAGKEKGWGVGISPSALIDLLLTAGKGPADPDLKPLQGILQRLYSLQTADKALAPTDIGSTETEYHSSFARGELGMALSYWDYSFAHTRPEFAWGVAPVPGSDRTPGVATLAMVTANAENQANARAFVKFAGGPDGAQSVVRIPGAPVPAYVTDTIAQDWLAHSTLKDDSAFVLHLKYIPTVDYPEQLASLLLTEADAALQGKKTVDEAIKSYEQARAPIVSKK